MIRLIYRSYMDKKKYMTILIFEILIIFVLIIMSYEKDQTYEMMMHQDYYQLYYEQLFIQIFSILNAMFVLFLAMDHDQVFFKPFFAYFSRTKVMLSKYMFHFLMIFIYLLHIFMLYQIVFSLLIPISIAFDLMMLLDLGLDTMIILNLILIMIRHKFKTLSVVIVLFYVLYSMFIYVDAMAYYYMFPIFQIQKKLNIVELIYKICYICLGFLIYMSKSMQEAV